MIDILFSNFFIPISTAECHCPHIRIYFICGIPRVTKLPCTTIHLLYRPQNSLHDDRGISGHRLVHENCRPRNVVPRRLESLTFSLLFPFRPRVIIPLPKKRLARHRWLHTLWPYCTRIYRMYALHGSKNKRSCCRGILYVRCMYVCMYVHIFNYISTRLPRLASHGVT